MVFDFILGNMFYFKVVRLINSRLHILCLLYLVVLKTVSFVLLQKVKSFVLGELEYSPLSHLTILGSANHVGRFPGMSAGA